ncbi:MAG: hypothetical protein ACI9VR_002398 [Cognaticolwellia sp.]|jgi:hypothetical protein
MAYLHIQPGLTQSQGGQQAPIVFMDQDASEWFWVADTAEDYLTKGAKLGFVWTWQLGEGPHPRRMIDRLLKASTDPRTSRSELLSMLVNRGATEAQADGLSRWLGDDVVFLLPK